MSIVWAVVIVVALFLLAGFVLVEERIRLANKDIERIVRRFKEEENQ